MPLMLLVLLGLLWSIYWFALSVTTQKLYATSQDDLARQGLSLTCGQQSWGGYPFRIEFTCINPKVTISQNGPPVTLKAASLTVLMQAYDYRHFIAFLDGETTITPAGMTPIQITHKRITASLLRRSNRLMRLAAETAAAEAVGIARAENLLINAELDPGGNADVAGSAQQLVPAARPDLALDEAAFEVAAPMSALTASAPLAYAVTNATPVDLKHFSARKGTLTVDAEGQASLGPDGKPLGIVTTTISDLDLMMAELRKVAPMKDDQATAMRTMLGLLAGGKTNAKIALKAREGALYWGPFKIADLPSLAPAH